MQSKGEIVMGTYNVVILRVQRVQQTRRTPSASKDHDCLLSGVVWLLGAGSTVLVSDIVEETACGDNGEKSDATGCLQDALPARRAWRRWGRRLKVQFRVIL